MTPDVKNAIKALRHAYLEMGSYETEKFWDILTALRGPDDENTHVKRATTELIRAAVFGRQAGALVYEVALIDWLDRPEDVEVRDKMQDSHFRVHAIKAFLALGLNWSSCNGEIIDIDSI